MLSLVLYIVALQASLSEITKALRTIKLVQNVDSIKMQYVYVIFCTVRGVFLYDVHLK